jgi:hypothetical protein
MAPAQAGFAAGGNLAGMQYRGQKKYPLKTMD